MFFYFTFLPKIQAHARKNKIKNFKEPLAVARTLTISVGLCCHVAYGTRQTVRLFPSCLCLLRDDRSKRTFVSKQQASGRLSSDLGGKGEKSRASCCGEQWCVCMAECVCREGGLHSSCGGQHGACDCEETANWSNCGGKTLGLLSGSCQCLSGLQLVHRAKWVCMFVCKEPKLEEPKIELLYVCV